MSSDIAAARAKLRGIIDTIYTKLPRELQEIIFKFVSAHENVTVNISGVQYANGRYCTYARPPRETYWQSDWTGPDFHRELIETFYRNSVFRIDPPSLDVLVAFMTRDAWGLDICPASLISRLELRIDNRLPLRSWDREKMDMAFCSLKTRAELRFWFDLARESPTAYRVLLWGWLPFFKLLSEKGYHFRVDRRVMDCGVESWDVFEKTTWETLPSAY